MAIKSSLPWQLGVMLGWCRRKMPFYGRTQGHVSRSEVLGNPPSPSIPPMAGFITAAAPKNACCSHSGAAPMETNIPSVGPLPSAIHPRPSTQVGYLGAGFPGAGCKWAGTDKGPHPCQVSRNPEWFQNSSVDEWALTQVHVSVVSLIGLSWVLGGSWWSGRC